MTNGLVFSCDLMMFPISPIGSIGLSLPERKRRQLKKLADKKSRQARKNRRLLERMNIHPKQVNHRARCPEMDSYILPGGVKYMGFPKSNRQIDTRRVPQSFPRIRGWKTVEIEGHLLVDKIHVRKMLGGRNGSEKKWDWRSREEKPIPRSEIRRLEIQEELAGIAEQEREDTAELAQLDKEMQREYQEWLEEEVESERRREEAEEKEWFEELWIENECEYENCVACCSLDDRG